MEVSPAPTPATDAQPAVSEVKAPVPTTPSPCRYAAVSTLLMRVDKLGDLPSGSVMIRTKLGVLEPFTTDKIPTDKLVDLIEQGRVYAIWGNRYAEFDELEEVWHRPGAVPPATEA